MLNGLKSLNQNMQSLTDFTLKFDQFPVEDYHRWTSGQCHEFAIALGRVVADKFDIPVNRMFVRIGERCGFEDGEEVSIFTHAVLKIIDKGQTLTIDCNGMNAERSWESEIEAREWNVNRHEKSEINWVDAPLEDVPVINELVFQIDGSRPVLPQNVEYAERKIHELLNNTNELVKVSDKGNDGCSPKKKATSPRF